MTTEQLTIFYRARPFKPFRINMADGRSLLIAHPEMMAYPEKARTCAVWVPKEKAYETIDLLLVTSLEPASNDIKRSDNGRGRKAS